MNPKLCTPDHYRNVTMYCPKHQGHLCQAGSIMEQEINRVLPKWNVHTNQHQLSQLNKGFTSCSHLLLHTADSSAPVDQDPHCGPVEEPFTVLGPIHSLLPSESLDIWIRVTHPDEKCSASRIRKDPLSIVLLSWWRDGLGATTYSSP